MTITTAKANPYLSGYPKVADYPWREESLKAYTPNEDDFALNEGPAPCDDCISRSECAKSVTIACKAFQLYERGRPQHVWSKFAREPQVLYREDGEPLKRFRRKIKHYLVDGKKYATVAEAGKAFGRSRKWATDRFDSADYPNWKVVL